MKSAPAASPSVLIDTNILIYAYDPSAGDKHRTALETMEEMSISGRMVLSAQVANEFYWVSTRPGRSPGLAHEEACEILSEICASGTVLPLTQATTFRALDAVKLHQLSFWDALIWAVAAENGISAVYSEDCQHGRVIDGVRFCNPFEAT